MHSWVRCFRWFLPFLILFIATQLAAQNAPTVRKNFNLLEQAKSGDASSQYAVGVEYLLGTGLPRDAKAAVYWTRKSAEQGFGQAQLSLGLFYYSGNGVPKNYEEAYFWLSLGVSAPTCVGCPPPGNDETVSSALDRTRQNLTPQKRHEIQVRCRRWAEAHPLHPPSPGQQSGETLVEPKSATSELVPAHSRAVPSTSSFPRFTLVQGNLDAEGPTSGAKLCVFERRDICYQMPSHTTDGPGGVTYEFGLNPRSERLPLPGGRSWVFFLATFSGGGSGTLERLAVLSYERDGGSGKIVNLMPFVAVTNVSDRAMWTVPSASEYPILVMADFIWSEGESHFGEHYYTVEAWRFDPGVGQYAKAFSYRTAKKYDGGDSAPVRVLAPERQEILRRLGWK